MTSGGNLQPNRAKDTRYDIDMKSPAKQVYWADRRAPGKASQSLPRSRSRPRSRWYCPPSPLSPPPVPAHSTNNCAPAPPSKEPGPPCVSIFGILPTQPLPRAPPACVFSFRFNCGIRSFRFLHSTSTNQKDCIARNTFQCSSNVLFAVS